MGPCTYWGPRASSDKVNIWNLLYILRELQQTTTETGEVNNEKFFTSLKSYYQIY